MNKPRILLPAALCLLLPLAAQAQPPRESATGSSDILQDLADARRDIRADLADARKEVRADLAKAKQELETGNLELDNSLQFGKRSNHAKQSKNALPRAEITPAGDLLIGGKAVAIDDAQRKLLLEYRTQIVKVAEAGIDVGVQGANLGMRAAGEAIKGIFSGDTDKIEERVNAEAKRLEESALKICEQMPAMLATQQQLATAVPEFKPYATMNQDDIEECRKGSVKLR